MSEVEYSKPSVYRTWLLICFTTGPVSSMTRTYIPAVLQSMARALGKTSMGETCSNKGNDCLINIGNWKIHTNSYVIYLKALYTFIEAIIALFIMNIADYSSYKKWILSISIILYGSFVIPFLWLNKIKSIPHFIVVSILYGVVNITNTIIQILEAAYIPDFMRASIIAPANEEIPQDLTNRTILEDERKEAMLRKGSKISVMGIVSGNCGGILALLIGIIITYSNKTTGLTNYTNYLIAVTVAGFMTLSFGLVTIFIIPSVHNKPSPSGFILIVAIKRIWQLIKNIRKYPNAFLLCAGWVIWSLSYGNFLTVWVLLFRSTLGLDSSNAEYTVYVWLSFVISSIGSLTWMVLYPRLQLTMKQWAYIFLGVSVFTNLWGSIGISKASKIGFKHRWEFWIADVLYSSTSSALRSLNRALYSSLLPKGQEAQYFGLEIMIGLLVNWASDLLMALIQDRTGNDRYPFLVNMFIVCIAVVFYFLCNEDQGMRDVTEMSDITATIEEEDNVSVETQRCVVGKK